jgi:hypothetical protein
MERNRSTLKQFFSEGALPSAGHFADLIDSTINQIDEGFDKTPADGLKIASLGTHTELVSFYRGVGSEHAIWTVRHDGATDDLLFGSGHETSTTPVLVLSTDDAAGRIGVNTSTPLTALDVAGTVRAEGRIGVTPAGMVARADGKWHDITGDLEGCQAFEVVAGIGKPGTGRYALLHATAMNTFNPSGFMSWLTGRKRIRTQHAFFRCKCSKLQLRWSGKGRLYRLQVRSRCTFEGDVWIRYYLTRLWFDPAMSGSAVPPEASGEAA